jgi:hypothetical protein
LTYTRVPLLYTKAHAGEQLSCRNIELYNEVELDVTYLSPNNWAMGRMAGARWVLCFVLFLAFEWIWVDLKRKSLVPWRELPGSSRWKPLPIELTL